MDEEDIIADARQAEEEIRREGRCVKRGPVMKKAHSIFLLLLLVFLIIVMVVPYSGVKLDPEPRDVPTAEQLLPANIDELASQNPGMIAGTRGNYRTLVLSGHPAIRSMASRIATISCPASDICYAKAMFQFVQENHQYVGDPPDEYLESPFETLYNGGADCDGLAILLANLVSGAGISTRFAFVPGHVFVQVKIDDAPRKYKQKDGWISIDPTCVGCDFGETSYSTAKQEKVFVYV
ncbi:transglutaminase domain-containing protein [Candidatus Woesearchaeota archaeon]|nr:transglutaminase domain-containing protein [Candidatus Woesearchaeota archaeon]